HLGWRSGKSRPQADFAARIDVRNVLAADAVPLAIGDHEILFLVDRIEQMDPTDVAVGVVGDLRIAKVVGIKAQLLAAAVGDDEFEADCSAAGPLQLGDVGMRYLLLAIRTSDGPGGWRGGNRRGCGRRGLGRRGSGRGRRRRGAGRRRRGSLALLAPEQQDDQNRGQRDDSSHAPSWICWKCQSYPWQAVIGPKFRVSTEMARFVNDLKTISKAAAVARR